MKEVVSEYLSNLRFGERQTFKNMSVFPVMDGAATGPDYLTLHEALEQGLLTVTEVSEGGSVPQLRVKNTADVAVLLLDGEELAGAKQNRVLNTTVLLAAHTETTIPVSCTEAGRWSYATKHFYDSGFVAASGVRRAASRSVTESLEASGEFGSNQMEVWASIDSMSAQAEVLSPTRAMRDVFQAKAAMLEEFVNAFHGVPEQKGLVVCLGSDVIGADVLSRPRAYAVLHPKLVKSYAMEAILQTEPAEAEPGEEAVRGFLAGLASGEARTYDSVGLGTDYRNRGKEAVCSALVHEGCVIHLAAFRTESSGDAGRMSAFRSRRGFRA